MGLANENLKAVFPQGIGFNQNENGAIIGYDTDGDADAGNHFSYRLYCVSDK
jgi:hypothetical protein